MPNGNTGNTIDPVLTPGGAFDTLRNGFGMPMPQFMNVDAVPMTEEELDAMLVDNPIIEDDIDDDDEDETTEEVENTIAILRAREEMARQRMQFQVPDPFRVGTARNTITPGNGVGTPAEQIARQERETQPYKISILRDVERYDGEGEVFPFVVKLTRGGESVESYGYYNEDDAVEQFDRWREDYKESLVHKTFGRVAEGMFKVNLLGENVDRRLERPRNRIDRRAIRPEEDVIAEEGLSLDINPNEPEPVADTVAGTARRPFSGGLQRDNRGRFVGQATF